MAISAAESNRTLNDYLKQDKGVNIRQNLEKNQKLEASGLKDIEIRSRPKQMGKDEFLKLLVTQLTHQDPTAPLKDQQFIAQMAQFSSLEQMQNIASGVSKLSDRQSLDLVGRFVVGKDENDEMISGVAEALYLEPNGAAYLKVGKHALSVDKLNLVGDPESFKKEFGGEASAEKKIETEKIENSKVDNTKK